MAHTLTASVNLGLVAQETADATTSPSSGGTGQGAKRIFDYLNKLLQFGAGTYPPINTRVIDIYTVLSGTTADIDLTAVPVAADLTKTVDLTGKKIVAMAFWVPKANTGATLRIAAGAATPYHIFGTSTDGITLAKGFRGVLALDGELDSAFSLATQAVAAGNKLIRITGTSGDKLYGILLFG